MLEQSELEELGHELFKGKAINYQAWKLDDKVWVRQRKKDWEPIKKRLEHIELPKNKIKTYEKYFLTGKVPRFNVQTLVSVCLLYMCWWHPDQSEKNWQLIKNVIWLIGGEYAIAHYEDSIEAMSKAGWPNLFIEEEGFPDGFMMGLEERMFNFIIDDDIENPFVKFNYDERKTKFCGYEDLPYSGAYHGGFSTGTWLTNADSCSNRYVTWQYDRAIKYWYASLTNTQVERDLQRRGSVIALERSLNAIAKYDDKSKPDHYKSIYVNKVRKILNEKPIPEKLKEMWEEAKKS